MIGKPESLLSYVKDRPGHDRRYALRCDKMEQRSWLETGDSAGRRLAADDRLVQDQREWMAGVRDGEYLSYYDKYYENRDSSLHALSSAGRKTSQVKRR